MLAALPLVALLGQVAKVDIRATGTPNAMQQSVLKATLMAAYAGAGLTVTAEQMTVNTGMYDATVIEVTGTSYTNEQIDGYWCMNDPALRNAFKDLAVLNTGLSDVTDVITCVGASGEGCASSTVCGSSGGSGGGGGGGDPAPAPAPEPESGGGGGSSNDDDDDEKLSTTAIVLITIGALVTCALLVCIVWPYIESCCTQSAPKSEPILSPVTTTPSGVALPTLFNAV